MSCDEVLEVSSHSTPYFRTPEFSNIMLENEKLMLSFLNAPKESRCVFLTTSGTGAMESIVMNVLNDNDKIIVINGGSFGQRFVDLCELHNRNFTEVKCEFGHQLKKEQLVGLEEYTTLLVNMHETSSGVLYDMDMISNFCKENHILLVIDAISAFIADELDMKKLNASVVITGSQKALACQPGVSLIALSKEAIKRVNENKEVCMYLSLKSALKNMDRGQTPFTPAVTTLLQINKRLNLIFSRGGVTQERELIAKRALDFRNNINDLPFEYVSESMSNAVTSLHPTSVGAKKIIEVLKNEYHIWVCPNGGDLADIVFRVGHIGNITKEDNLALINALHDMKKRGII